MFAASCRALVDHELGKLLQGTLLQCEGVSDLSSYVQPASIDLPLSGECYLVKDRVLPHCKRVAELIPGLRIFPVDLSAGAVLLKGQTYLALCGRVKMPQHCRGSLSPKSSIGRVDIMVRGVFDNCGLYDTVAPGAEGDLWMEITPRSFNVRVTTGQALSQMMVFDMTRKEPMELNLSEFPPLLFNLSGSPIQPLPLHHDGSVILHLGLEPAPSESEQASVDAPEPKRSKGQTGKGSAEVMPTSIRSARVIGWEALPSNDVVDLSKHRAHPAARFFRPVYASKQDPEEKASITLEKDRFYILATKERISVPLALSAEMVPFSHHIGELRAHYAGFFDPGFGFGRNGAIKGTVGVLEVRPHETVTIFDGQPICLIEFFRNSALPKVAYGDAGNSYQNQQGAKLAKYFVDQDDGSLPV